VAVATVTEAGVVVAAEPAPAVVTGVVVPDHSSKSSSSANEVVAVTVIEVIEAALWQRQISTRLFAPDRKAATSSAHVLPAESVMPETDWVPPVLR
jgi:hypothetical protein